MRVLTIVPMHTTTRHLEENTRVFCFLFCSERCLTLTFTFLTFTFRNGFWIRNESWRFLVTTRRWGLRRHGLDCRCSCNLRVWLWILRIFGNLLGTPQRLFNWLGIGILSFFYKELLQSWPQEIKVTKRPGELTCPLRGAFGTNFPFPRVGYVSYLEGNTDQLNPLFGKVMNQNLSKLSFEVFAPRCFF